MAATSSTHDARLNFRLRREHKELIEEAARSLGQTVSDFAIAALVRDARQALQGNSVTRMTMRDQEVFLRMLDSDAEPSPALRRAVKRHKERRA